MDIRCKFDDNERPYWAIEIVAYMNEDGRPGWAYVEQGDATVNDKIGLIERIKHEYLMANYTPSEED